MAVVRITSPNHIEFKDNHGDMIHLIKPMIPENQHTKPETGQPGPYDSGYKHGVSDAKMEKMNPTSHSLYIVQPGKNLPSRTQNFTWGYIAGYYPLQSCADKNSTDNPRYTTIMNHESQ